MKKIVSMLLAMVMLIAAVPAMATDVGNYYTVSELVFTDFDDNVIENTDGKSSMVRAIITKNKARVAVDAVIMMAYSADNRLISFNVMKGTMVTGADTQFSALINVPEGKTLGYVKATVWDSVTGMNALSNVSKLEVNTADDPVQPDVPDQPENDMFKVQSIDTESYFEYNTVWETSSSVLANPYLYVYETEDSKTQKCDLARDFEMYVNNILIPKNQTNFEKYILDNVHGISFDDSDSDGVYDGIYADYYATAQIDSVNTSTGRIGFIGSFNADNRMNFFLNEDVSYTIYHNGKGIDISELNKYDVITVAYDVSASAPAFSNSEFYEIYVSRDTAEGVYNGKNQSSETVIINETEYKYFGPVTDIIHNLTLDNSYKVYLDVFGRIFNYDILSSSDNYAILERYRYSAANDCYTATLYTTDGEAKTYEIDERKVMGPNGETSEINEAWAEIVTPSAGTKSPVQDRVVKYKISSSGKITRMELLPPSDTTDNTSTPDIIEMSEYNAYRQAVGFIYMDDNTKIIDAIEYEAMRMAGQSVSHHSLCIKTVSNFADGGKYGVWAFGEMSSSGTYPFVLVTATEPEYKLAVITEYQGLGINENGDEVYKLTALYEGEEFEFSFDDTVKYYNKNGFSYVPDFKKGDVVAFEMTPIEKISAVYTVAASSLTGLDTNYNQVWMQAMTNSVTANLYMPHHSWTTDWAKNGNDEWTVLSYGPVIAKTSNYVRIGGIKTASSFTDSFGNAVTDETYYTDITSDYREIKLTDATMVYTWDYNYSKYSQLCYSNMGFASIVPTFYPTAALYNNGTILPYGTTSGVKNENATTNFALVKSVDGYATEIFMILAK